MGNFLFYLFFQFKFHCLLILCDQPVFSFGGLRLTVSTIWPLTEKSLTLVGLTFQIQNKTSINWLQNEFHLLNIFLFLRLQKMSRHFSRVNFGQINKMYDREIFSGFSSFSPSSFLMEHWTLKNINISFCSHIYKKIFPEMWDRSWISFWRSLRCVFNFCAILLAKVGWTWTFSSDKFVIHEKLKNEQVDFLQHLIDRLTSDDDRRQLDSKVVKCRTFEVF